MRTVGLVELNLLFLIVGSTITWALTGWTTWVELARDVCLSYMLGLASVGVTATLVLIAGFGLSYASILLAAGGVAAIAVGVALRRRTPLPRIRGTLRRPSSAEDVIAAVFAAVTLIVVLEMLRAFRNQPLVAWDAWSFWIPKAKTIYFFGGIDNKLFQSFAAPSYPLFVPALDAMVFRFTHSTDESLLAVQNWFLMAGFIGAAGAILGRIARRSTVWIFLAVAAVVPEIEHRWFQLMADWTLDLFFALAALLLLRWIRTGERWTIVASTLPFAAMLATKREGQLLAAALLIGGLAASYGQWRTAWPKVIAVALAAYAFNIPWRIWWSVRHLPPDTPDFGHATFTGPLGRLLPSLKLVLEVTFDYRLWLVVVPLALIAALAALGTRLARDQAFFYLMTGVAVVFAFTWVLWTDPTYPLTTLPSLTPIPRAMGSLTLLSVVLAPAMTTSLTEGIGMPVLDLPGRDTFGAARRAFGRVVAISPRRVVGGFIVIEWVAIIAAAARIRHAGWIFYQGGDQLWYYTLGWALGHGHLTQTPVGYGWSLLITPIALVAGPNLVSAFPAIILINVLILMPVGMLALYGIATRIGGRIFGYWALLLWVVVPFIGILYTNTGYHQKYTELLLPQAFGLTAMADFPTTVAALVSVYFCVRAVTSEHPELLDGLACGAAAGIAIAIKPSTSIFLGGIIVVLAYRRRFAITGAALAGIVPSLAALALWKERGLGNVPLLSHSAPGPPGVAAASPLASLNLSRYTHEVSWSRFLNNLDLIREHFWSNRLIEWLVIAGLIGLARRSRTAALLVGVWFAAFAIIKGGYAQASVEDGSFFRVMMPSYPAFLLLLASVPLLLPHAPKALRDYTQTFRRPAARTRWALLGATIFVSGVVPLAAFAAASRGSGLDATTVGSTIMPIPGNVDLGLSAKVSGRAVVLSWRKQDPFGGPVFFRIWRGRTDVFTCSTSTAPGGRICNVNLPEVGTTHADQFIDHPGPGHWVYRVAIAANWLNSAGYGDPYLVSSPVTVTRR